MISTTCLSNWENCHRRCTELSNCHRRIIIAQLQEKTAQFQQDLESLRTVNANLKFMNAKLVAENKEVTDMVATDINDRIQAELERFRQHTEKRFDHMVQAELERSRQYEANIERILKDRSRLATENSELLRKYKSLKDMYLELCAKS